MKIIQLIIVIVTMSSGLWAQESHMLSASIDRDSILVGQHIHYSLIIPKQFDKSQDWPKWNDTIGKFEVVEKLGIDTLENGFRQNIILTTFDSGTWTIPSVSIVGSDYSSSAIPVYCNIVPVDTSKAYKPIYGIRQVDSPAWSNWWWILIALILIATSVAIYFYIKRKKENINSQPLVSLTPYERAIAKIDDLAEKEMYNDVHHVKEYYSELTDLMRHYFYEEYQVNAMESTTDELLQRIRKVTKLNQRRDDIMQVLHLADLAKFAKTQPNPEENKEALQTVRKIINWAKPKVKEENTTTSIEKSGKKT